MMDSCWCIQSQAMMHWPHTHAGSTTGYRAYFQWQRTRSQVLKNDESLTEAFTQLMVLMKMPGYSLSPCGVCALPQASPSCEVVKGRTEKEFETWQMAVLLYFSPSHLLCISLLVPMSIAHAPNLFLSPLYFDFPPYVTEKVKKQAIVMLSRFH